MKKNVAPHSAERLEEQLLIWQVRNSRQGTGYLFIIHLFAGVSWLLATVQDPLSYTTLAWIGYFFLAWFGAAFLLSRATNPDRLKKNPRLACQSLLGSALIWSSPWVIAITFMMPGDPIARLAAVCIVLILVASTSHIMGSHFPATAVSTLCIVLPVAIRSILDSSQLVQALGVVLFAFLSIYLVLCFRSYIAIRENWCMRIENERLINELQAQQQLQEDAMGRMERALSTAEQACLDKSRFLAAASHDLRQPMHAISLFVAALKSEDFESRTRYLLDRLDRSLAGLDDLFNRLLDISRLDAGLIVPSKKVVDALLVAQTLEYRFMPLAVSKNLSFKVRCGAGLLLRSDPELLVELLSNFLSNAFRYTEQGGVLLTFRARNDHVLIQVWDTGCGIAAHHQDLIFDEFIQLDNSARDRRKGLGLGLAIVKRLANALGHRMEVHSQVGRGSSFGLQVERAADSAVAAFDSPQTPLAHSRLDGALVLVVDDEIDILSAMEAILASWGCLSILARSPEEAAKYVDSSLRFPDVIISDHRLQNHQTSFDVNLAIAPIVPYEIPMIVVSGESSVSLKREIGARGWVLMSKPVNAARLHAAMCHAMEETSAALRKIA